MQGQGAVIWNSGRMKVTYSLDMICINLKVHVSLGMQNTNMALQSFD